MSDDLIKRLENATGSDRELDVAIFEAVLLDAEMKQYDAESWFCESGGHSYGFNTRGDPIVIWRGEIPRLTASIDAALTLVPEGWAVYEMGQTTRRVSDGWYVMLMGTEKSGEASSSHKFFAIALCIAALRARAAIEAKTETTTG